MRTLLSLLLRPPLDLIELHDVLPEHWRAWLLDRLSLTEGYAWLLAEEVDDVLQLVS